MFEKRLPVNIRRQSVTDYSEGFLEEINILKLFILFFLDVFFLNPAQKIIRLFPDCIFQPKRFLIVQSIE